MKNLFFIFSFVVIGCNQSGQSSKSEDSIKFTKAVQIFETFKGDIIRCLPEIDEFYTYGAAAILCYTVSDCSSCVERGFQLLNYIQTASDYKTVAIVNASEVETRRTKYMYAGKMLNDYDDKLIKEFFYIFTPYILLVSEGRFINGYYIDNQKEYKDDIKYISNLLEK